MRSKWNKYLHTVTSVLPVIREHLTFQCILVPWLSHPDVTHFNRHWITRDYESWHSTHLSFCIHAPFQPFCIHLCLPVGLLLVSKAQQEGPRGNKMCTQWKLPQLWLKLAQIKSLLFIKEFPKPSGAIHAIAFAVMLLLFSFSCHTHKTGSRLTVKGIGEDIM